MAKKWLLIVGSLSLVAAMGCSQSAIPSASVATATVAATTAPLPGSELSGAKPSTESTPPAGPTEILATTAKLPSLAPPAAPFSDIGNLFAPPKETAPLVTPQPELDPAPSDVMQPEPEKAPLPQLQLVGFVEVEGVKALLSVSGKLNVVAVGERVDGLQIVAIEPPTLTLKQGDDGDSLQMNWFEQPWFHQASPAPNDRKGQGPRPMPRSNSSPNPLNGGIPPGIGAKSPLPVPAISPIRDIAPPTLPGLPTPDTNQATGGSKKSTKNGSESGSNSSTPRLPSSFPPAALPGASRD